MGDMSYADVQARAAELGITPVIGKKREFLEAAIAAEEKRRADEAAAPTADQASSSGAGTGGEGTPADDPAASATGEAGTPPETPPAAAPPARAARSHSRKTDAVAEPVGSAGRIVHWNCSVGDLDGGTEDVINAHIADVH